MNIECDDCKYCNECAIQGVCLLANEDEYDERVEEVFPYDEDDWRSI